MARYRVTLCSRTGVKYGVLKLAGSGTPLELPQVLNGGDTASLSLNLDQELIAGPNRRRLSSWASEIVVDRMSGPGLKGPVFAGPVTKPHADLDSESLTVACSSVWAWLGERQITGNHTYGGREQLDIARDLIGKYTTGLGPAGDIRLDLATLNSGVKVSQLYTPADQKTVATAVGDLSGATNGFDFEITLSRVQGKLIRTWQPYFPLKGRKVDITLTPGRGGLRNFSLEEATSIATRVVGYGDLTEHAQASQAIEDTYGIHSASISLVSANSSDLLLRQVTDYLKQRTPPVPIVSFAYQVSERLPYGWLQTGDSVRVKAGKGWCEYDDWVRVIAQSLSVDAQGNEVVSCTAAGVPGGIS